MAVTTIPSAGLTLGAQVNFRNLIINGDMSIAQRGTSFTGLTNGSSEYTLDRFKFVESGSPTSVFTVSQESTAPDGFSNSLKIACTTSGSGHNVIEIIQSIEAQNLKSLAFGTSSAKSFTLSFWVKSNQTGTGTVSFYNLDALRQRAENYTINVANTWEYKTITVSGDTSGGFNNDNGIGLTVYFPIAASTSYNSGSTGSWGSYSDGKRGAGMTIDLTTSTSDYLQITGVQLEAGTTASDFEFLPKDMNLQRCMRYYQIYNYMGNPGSEFGYSLPIRQSSAGNKQWMITTTLPIGVRTSSATLSWDSARTGSAGSAYDGSWLYETTSASNRWATPTNTFQSKADGDTYSQLFNSISSVITDNTNFTSGETTTFSSRLIVDAEL